jgi:hypothetical protein
MKLELPKFYEQYLIQMFRKIIINKNNINNYVLVNQGFVYVIQPIGEQKLKLTESDIGLSKRIIKERNLTLNDECLSFYINSQCLFIKVYFVNKRKFTVQEGFKYLHIVKKDETIDSLITKYIKSLTLINENDRETSSYVIFTSSELLNDKTSPQWKYEIV